VSSAAVTKISPGGATTTYAGAAADADGIAYDGAGNMWVSYYQGNGTVSKVNASSGVFTNYSGGGGYEDSIAFDGTNIWQMDTDDGILTKFSPAGSVLAEYNIGASGRGGIAYDGAGNMWVNGAVGSGGGVTLINKNTGATTTYSGSGIGGGTNIGPVQIASDGTGNMWTVNGPYVSSTVTKISPTGTVATYSGGGAGTNAIAYDGAGNMWTANCTSNSVTKVAIVPHAGGGGTTITVASQGSGYVASGTLDSVTLDTGVASGTQLNSFIWQGSANSSTAVKFQVAVSNSSSGPWNYMGPSGDASTYFTGSPGASISLASTNGSYALFAGYRYFRYRATLYSDGAHLYTPNLTGIVVNWSP
jgi:sugar lactone lactonase YvrE